MAVLACSLQTSTTASPPALIAVTATALPPVATATTPSQPTAVPVPGGLTMDMLRNDTYFAPAYGRTVTLVNGAYSEKSAAGDYSVQMLDVHAIGDLNGDGVEDAVVILAENDGGTGQFESLIAISNSGGTPIQVGQSTLGDRVQVNSMDVSSGVVHLNMIVQGPNDPMCCPSLAEKRSYWMIAGHLWLMRVTTTLGGSEQSINVDSPANWADVSSPFTINGEVTISPFENTLADHIYLADGTKVNDSTLLVIPSGMGTAGTFSQSVNLSMAGVTGWVVIQFVDVSAADGSTLAMASVVVNVY